MSELEQTEVLERSRTVTPDLASVSSQVASPMESYKLPLGSTMTAKDLLMEPENGRTTKRGGGTEQPYAKIGSPWSRSWWPAPR